MAFKELIKRIRIFIIKAKEATANSQKLYKLLKIEYNIKKDANIIII